MALARSSFLALLCFCFLSAFPQSPATYSRGEITNLSEAKFVKAIEEVSFNGLGATDKIPYSRIKGSRFWKDEWQDADIYTKAGTVYTVSVRIDLSTGNIHFLKNGEELVLTGVAITRIVFRNDTATFLFDVPNLVLHNKKLEEPVQELNAGQYQLLKYVKRTVSSADSLFRTQKRYFFKDEVYYFLKSGEKVVRIKKLTKDNLMEHLPSSAGYSAWLRENTIDFKKESDIVRFINYYNNTHFPVSD